MKLFTSPLHAALLVVFVDALGVGIVVPSLPDLISELCSGDASATAWYVGLVGSSYAAMQFIFAPLAGKLSDTYGRRRILRASMLALAVDSVVQALAPNVIVLLCGRIIAGVAGSSIATANALVADVSEDDQRFKNFGMVGAVYGLGLVLGPAIGAATGLVHLRIPFVAIAIISIATFLLLGKLLQVEAKRQSNQQVHVSEGFKSQSKLLTRPLIAFFAAAVLLSSMAQRGLENLFVFFTEMRFDWSRGQAGLSLCLMGVLAIVVQGGFSRPVISRLGEQSTVLLSLAIMFVTYIGLSLITQGWTIYPLLVLGAFSGLAGPALQSFITQRIDKESQGQVQGIFVSVVSLSGIIAPIVFTSILFRQAVGSESDFTRFGYPFQLAAALVIGSAIFARLGFKSK